MSLAPRPWAAELLHLWFDVLKPGDWFRQNEALDFELRRRFASEWAMLRHRPAGDFLCHPQVARAAILLFDQVPRNIFRGSAKAFASDSLARTITKGVLARGWHQGLSVPQRQFIFMPLMHSENIADQRRSLRLFAALDSPFILSFARSHHAMIARFGRFPHRNAVLGRMSTAAERRAIAAGNEW